MSKKLVSSVLVKLALVAVGYALYLFGVPLKVLGGLAVIWLAASLIYLAFKLDPPKKEAA